ncbi:uncharacterized protein LOC118204968, partial [Stegodyphus dumicola]|uniref:uncharacterized protein LOC118204968 n=1 Tax=Stegodyphus dumicola TaxID=202533 RepID=UPI0015AB891E
MAPTLSRKVLFPSSIEKQNVSTAIKLFDEKTLAALQIESQNNRTGYGKDVLGTKHFIDIILKWWKIVNVKHSKKALQFRDVFMQPIRTPEDKSLEYLSQFCSWLISWNDFCPTTKNCKSQIGKLSKETQVALLHTTATLNELSKYLLKEFKLPFILLGKFQTDNLEGRFGQFRQMSGCNYNVSLQQIIESERKLKLISLLKMQSSEKGSFILQHFSCNDIEDFNDYQLIDKEFVDVLHQSND